MCWLGYQRHRSEYRLCYSSITRMKLNCRHRTLKEVMRALMQARAPGGAGPLLREYANTTAGAILNISMKIRDLRKAGRPGKGRSRPLAPFEKVINKGEHVDLKVL